MPPYHPFAFGSFAQPRTGLHRRTGCAAALTVAGCLLLLLSSPVRAGDRYTLLDKRGWDVIGHIDENGQVRKADDSDVGTFNEADDSFRDKKNKVIGHLTNRWGDEADIVDSHGKFYGKAKRVSPPVAAPESSGCTDAEDDPDASEQDDSSSSCR